MRLFYFMNISKFIELATKKESKKKSPLEKDIEKNYVEYAKHLGCIAYKLVFLRGMGFPDRTTLCPGGRLFFIEFKRKNKPLTQLQEKYRKILVGLGFEYYVCDTKGQAEKILRKFLLRNK